METYPSLQDTTLWNAMDMNILHKANKLVERILGYNMIFCYSVLLFMKSSDMWRVMALYSTTYNWPLEKQILQKSFTTFSRNGCPWAFFVHIKECRWIGNYRRLNPSKGNDSSLGPHLTPGRDNRSRFRIPVAISKNKTVFDMFSTIYRVSWPWPYLGSGLWNLLLRLSMWSEKADLWLRAFSAYIWFLSAFLA